MKTEIIESKVEEKSEYPKLMIAKDKTVVLFKSEGEGTCLNAGGLSRVNETHASWDMDCFKPFTGKLVLSND